MPLQRRGYLKPDELYSVTAYLLHLNGIIAETDVMDAKTLPQVQMPNRKGYCLLPSRSGSRGCDRRR